MSTTSIKIFPDQPYWDTFDETKNYHRVLFRPGYAVQARELTQMQTALQAQIDRHGQYAFKDGSRVVNGEVSVNIEYDYIKVESTFTHSAGTGSVAGLSNFKGEIITGSSQSGNQVTAVVLDVIVAAGGDADTLYIAYQSKGGPAKDVDKFVVGEVFTATTAIGLKYGMVGGGTNTDGAGADSVIANAIGQGSSASIREGVYFISGCFTYVPEATLILDKYTSAPTYIVGLQVAENLITSAEDGNLNDNAQGVPNTAAPGASRYQIATTLIKESVNLGDPTDASASGDSARTILNYIPLLTVTNGIVSVDTSDKTSDTGLTIRLARRTYEESGSYVTKPFELEILEHLNTGTNFGKYLAADGGSTDKIALGIEPSVAYVQGFRAEKLVTEYVDVDKPRGANSTGFQNLSYTQIQLGNYVKLSLTGLRGIPDLETYKTITLKAAGASVGTARVRGFESYSDHVRLYLFDITMTTGAFSAVDNVYQAAAGGGYTENFVGNFVPAADGMRFDAGNNRNVFKLPQDAIKTLRTNGVNDTVYKVKKVIPVIVSSGQLIITESVGKFADTADITIAPIGIDVKTSTAGNATVAANFQTITFDCSGSGLNIPNGTVCRVISTVEKNAAQKQKTNTTATTTINVTNGNAASYELEKADIISITSIVDSASVDVTDRFTFDNGQRDNFYAEGKIIKLAATAAVATGNMVITFKHYAHSVGDYFSVDSYSANDYDTIPTFDSTAGTLELRDCIDFRPLKAQSGATTGSEFSTGAGYVLSPAPKVGHALKADLAYYLPRIDKLFIKRDGTFEIAKGVPSERPAPPEDREDALTLYQLRMRPYGFTLADIVPAITDNKRYTMRDIGKLDKRLKNVEYYTSLSLLEQSAADTHIVDANGKPRFKNGFIVDTFKDHSIGNPANPDHKCSIDKIRGVLRAKYDSRNVNLIKKPGVTDTASKNGSIWTMPYDQHNETVQPYASVAINVNPYNVFDWGGQVRLSPESDEWKEVDVRPDIIIDENGQYDQFVIMANETGILGTVWNEWETNWVGREVSADVTSERARQAGRTFDQTKITTVTTTTVTSAQSRSGLRTDVGFDTVSKETGARVVETNFVPFMRSRKIFFEGTLMKPNTKVFAFFNNINVTGYCKSEAFQEWSDQSSDQSKLYTGLTSHPGASSGSLITDANGTVSGTFIIPRNEAIKFKTGVKEFKLSDTITNDPETETTYCSSPFFAQGVIESVQNTITNTKVPKLVTTEVGDNQTLSETFVSSEVTWIDPLAQTILIEKKGGLFATGVDLFFRTKATKTQVPVSISIRAVVNGIPTQRVVPGTEVTLNPGSVNVSATSAVSTAFTFDHPVYLEQDAEYAIVIISACNEYEAWVAEMGGFDVTDLTFRITKQPHGGSFFTSQNASTWTPDQSKDLKFVLRRAKFKQGSGTAMVDGGNNTSQVTFCNEDIPLVNLKADPFSTTSGSNVVRVTHTNHGMYSGGSKVTIAGVGGTVNGITVGQLEGTHNVTGSEQDSYLITLTGASATSTGSGGGSTILATENRQFDVLHPQIQNIQVPGTEIRYYVSTLEQTAVDGTQTAYGAVDEFEVLANSNSYFSNPKVVSSTAQGSGNLKTFSIRAVLSSTGDHLSPVIDQNRASIITVQNIIGDAINNQGSYNNYVPETAASGGSELCKYITKKIDLAEEADTIDLYMTANRPSGSSIDLYYKVLPAGSDDDFGAELWVAMASSDAIPVNNNPNAYTEVKYAVDPTGSFGSMAFKIVLRSNNTSAIPTIRDFRAIAST